VGDDMEGKRGDGSCNCSFAVIISLINNIILIKSHASSILLLCVQCSIVVVKWI
jgi:hypothetical protein